MKNLKTKLLLPALMTATIASAHGAEFVLNSDSTFNPSHENRFSFLLGTTPSLTKSADMQNFTFSYGRKMENYWIDTNFAVSKGTYGKFGITYPSKMAAVTTLEDDEQKNTLTTIGIGIARETRYAQTLLPFNDIYELMAANITYNSYKDELYGKTFSGPGLLAKFSVYKRFNDYFSAGAHFNYNLAVVKRAQENDTEETSSERSLTLGFLTVGIDVSFYL